MNSTSHVFGEHLKREREMRGVSLEEIAAATRISIRFLEALENEQWERLPGGIFNRGFIRSVAKFLGMDEEGLVAEYALETRERPEIAVWTKEPVRQRPNWAAIVAAVVVIFLVVAAAFYGHRRYGPAVSAWHQSHPIFRTVFARFGHQKPSASPNPPSATAAPIQPPPHSIASPQTAPQSAAQSQPAKPAATSGDSTTRNPSSPSAPPASANSALLAIPMELKVEAGETSDVVVLADGKTVFSGKLEALRTLTLHAQTSFTVSSSKSSAVLLELNGRTVPPLGPPGQPGKITLTRDNLKSNSGGAN
ncbi:MAG: RodZ domain-containing protein [Candidatus Acidiferrales bacterium]